MSVSKTLPLFTLLALVSPPVAAQGSAGPAAPAWVVADSGARTVRLSLEVSHPAGAPSALINGHREGSVQVVVPLGWTVNWEWTSTDSAASHSLVVMAEREKLPMEGGSPAFTNAMTRMLSAGLPAGQADRTAFEADQPGWYWLLCGVPTHALGGEWIGLKVDPEARTASVVAKK